MKILMINSDDRMGGAARVAHDLMAKCEQAGISVILYAKNVVVPGENIKSIDEENGRRKHRLYKKFSDISRKLFNKDIPSFVIYSVRDIKCSWLATDIEYFSTNFIKNNPDFLSCDLVHLHNLHGNYFNLNLLSFISKYKPIVWTLHDMWPITGHCAQSLDCTKYTDGCGECPYLGNYPPILWDNTKRLWRKKKIIYKNSKLHLVAPSKWLAEKVGKSILKHQPLHSIPHGIEMSVFKNIGKFKAREKLKLSQDNIVISFVASFGKNNPWKGWEYFKQVVEYFAKRKDFIFLCVGGKSGESEKGNIKYIKYINDKSAMAEIYSATDVLVNPSLAESYSLVIIEALACGTPVVTFPVGIAVEAVKHKSNGYIAEYEKIDDIIEGIEFFLSRKDNDNQSEVDLNKWRKKYDIDLMFAKYLDLYQGLFKKNG